MAQRSMPAFTIIEHLNVFENIFFSIFVSFIYFVFNPEETMKIRYFGAERDENQIMDGRKLLKKYSLPTKRLYCMGLVKK